MDARHERLKWAREQAGYAKASDAVTQLGWVGSTYYGHENGDRKFNDAYAKKYAAAFKVPWLWLTAETNDKTLLQPEVEREKLSSLAPNAVGGRQDVEFDDRNFLPVRGVAVGGDDGLMIMDGEVRDHVLCPPKLIGVPDAYAVFVAGESMEPRYYADEVVYLHPRRPLKRGCFVLVELHTDQAGTSHAFVKQFVTRTATHLVLKQFNPPKEIEIEIEAVKNCHRIIGSGEA